MTPIGIRWWDSHPRALGKVKPLHITITPRSTLSCSGNTCRDPIDRFVVYWPPTRPSCQNKKFTCVNNRCIRSKRSGCDLGCRRVELSGVEQWYNRGETGSQAVGVQGLKSAFQIELREPALSREAGHPGPRLSCPGKRERRTVMAGGAGGQYVAVFVRSPTPSHTQPFQIKWGVYFFKELCRSSLLCWICFCTYMCMYSCSWLCNSLNGTI